MTNGAAFSMGSTENRDSGSNATRSNITQALQIIHDSRSDNDTRQRASTFLESQKRSKDAAQNGFNLAVHKTEPAVVRHFGLSLLEDAVRHSWSSFSDAEVSNMRNWTITLIQSISGDDPLYLRNKVAQLLLEVAKKDWAISWYDMDSLLLALWNQSTTYKELVLTVLENLSEDVFIRDDSAAGLRGQDLNNAVVEIFTPASAFAGGQNKGRHHLRADEDGWLVRISQLLANTFWSSSNESNTKACVCKALATLRSAFTWVMGPAIITADCLGSLLACLLSSDADVLVVGTSSLLQVNFAE
jgi:exportin-5